MPCHKPHSSTTQDLPTWTILSAASSDDENMSTPAPTTPSLMSAGAVKPEPTDSGNSLVPPLGPHTKQGGKQHKEIPPVKACIPLKKKVHHGNPAKTVTFSPNLVSIPPFGNPEPSGSQNNKNNKTTALPLTDSHNQNSSNAISSRQNPSQGSASFGNSRPRTSSNLANAIYATTSWEATKSTIFADQILSGPNSSVASTPDPLLRPLSAEPRPPILPVEKSTACVPRATAKRRPKEVFLGVYPPPRKRRRHLSNPVAPLVTQTELVKALTSAFNANAITQEASPSRPRPAKKPRIEPDPSGLADALTAALTHNATELSPTPTPLIRRLRPFVSLPARPKSPIRKDVETDYRDLFGSDPGSDRAASLFPENEDEVEPIHAYIDRCQESQVAPVRMEDIDWGIRMEHDTIMQNLFYFSHGRKTQEGNANLPPRLRHLAVKEQSTTYKYLRTMVDTYGPGDVMRGSGSKPKVWNRKQPVYIYDSESESDDDEESENDRSEPEPSFRILPSAMMGRLRPRAQAYAQELPPPKPSTSRRARESMDDDPLTGGAHVQRSSSVVRHQDSSHASPPSTPSVANGTDGSREEEEIGSTNAIEND
ncbi:hypothetical protein BDN72DRAFT_833296 [Pluteus cervinus]|uniref:Uncharacterized protein n=1 Tax=Pluteus cervinus TaxID=181527 RepID=A0ACD3B970_9AGAR|nr:hypothetical protein BDN72DRAFT_833296 [Pluteus cervinus]